MEERSSLLHPAVTEAALSVVGGLVHRTLFTPSGRLREKTPSPAQTPQIANPPSKPKRARKSVKKAAPTP